MFRNSIGQTWTGPWNVASPGLSSTRFHAVSAGDDGRVVMVYLGKNMSRGPEWRDEGGEDHTWAGAPDDAPPASRWHLCIVTLEDNGTDHLAFTSHQVTPDEDPVQIGCTSVGAGRNCRNLLHFIDTAMAPNGTFYGAYTEGCTVREECAGNAIAIDEMEARDSQIAVAWLENWSLRG